MNAGFFLYLVTYPTTHLTPTMRIELIRETTLHMDYDLVRYVTDGVYIVDTQTESLLMDNDGVVYYVHPVTYDSVPCRNYITFTVRGGTYWFSVYANDGIILESSGKDGSSNVIEITDPAFERWHNPTILWIDNMDRVVLCGYKILRIRIIEL